MAASKIPYIFFLAVLFLFNFFYYLTPFLAAEGNKPAADALYTAYAPTCHQLISRSLCVFKYAGGDYSIGDCLSTSELSYSRATQVKYEDKEGYKIPVCSRDVAIYTTMLLGLLILPFLQKIESEEWPNRWILVIAALPTAIDGTTQLLGLRESTNFLRIITGTILGIVLPFYILPILNSLFRFIRQKRGKKES